MTELNAYGLRWLWTWVRDIALFIFLLVMLLIAIIFNIDWANPG